VVVVRRRSLLPPAAAAAVSGRVTGDQGCGGHGASELVDGDWTRSDRYGIEVLLCHVTKHGSRGADVHKQLSRDDG